MSFKNTTGKSMRIPIPQRTKYLQSLYQFEDLLITNHQQMTLVHHPTWNVKLTVPIFRLSYPWMLGDGLIELKEIGISRVEIRGTVTDSSGTAIAVNELHITCIGNYDEYIFVGTKEGYLVSIHRETRSVSDFILFSGWISHIGLTTIGIFVALPELHVSFVPFSSGKTMDFENNIIIDRAVKQVQHMTVHGNSVAYSKPNTVSLATIADGQIESLFEWTIPLCMISGLVFGMGEVRAYSTDAQLYAMTIPKVLGIVRSPTEVKDESMSFLQYTTNYGQAGGKPDEDEDGDEDENLDSKLRLFGVISSYHGILDTYLIGDLSQERWGTELRQRVYFGMEGKDWEQLILRTLGKSEWIQAGGSYVIDDILKAWISDTDSLSRLIDILVHGSSTCVEPRSKLRVLALVNYCILQKQVILLYIRMFGKAAY
jgi:hypothetical protein